MPKFVVKCASGFCGVTQTYLIEASDAEEAEQWAYREWLDRINPHIKSVEEATEDDENIGYIEI